jgi:Reverse transcriptase (RNA-dependent DNA polymerase)
MLQNYLKKKGQLVIGGYTLSSIMLMEPLRGTKQDLFRRGYTETYGVDFQEILSPVEKLNIVRVLLSLAANMDWPLHQFNVKNVFLHGKFEEKIYMDLSLKFRKNMYLIF